MWLAAGAGLVLIIGFAIVIADAEAKQQKKVIALSAYNGALSELKLNPSDPDLRQRALEVGRVYCRLMREENKETIFDEMALMNDINAACAATQQVIAGPQPSGDIEERFRRLQGLMDQGLIGEDDYTKRKSELMAQI